MTNAKITVRGLGAELNLGPPAARHVSHAFVAF